MTGAVRLLISVLATAQHASSFSIPDTFHIMQTAQTAAVSLSHTHHVPHLDLLESYKHLLSTHPLPTKMITGATLAVCGDAIAQSQDASTEYDKRRASSFAVFDMAYRALQHFSFPIIIAACHGQYLGSLPVIGDTFDATQLSAMEQTLASQLGIVPFLYYPAFFALTGVIQGLTTSQAVNRAQETFLPLMQRNLLFWIPMQFIQFGYIQEDLQIPFLSVCGLGWTFILSAYAGAAKNYSPEKEMEDNVALSMQQQPDEAVVEEISAAAMKRAAKTTSY